MAARDSGLKGRGLPTPPFYVSLHFSGLRGSCLIGMSYEYRQWQYAMAVVQVESGPCNMTDATSTTPGGRLGYNTVNPPRTTAMSESIARPATSVIKRRLGAGGLLRAQDNWKQKESSMNSPVQ